MKAAHAEWLLLMAAGLGLAMSVSKPYTLTLLGSWIAGCLYNIPSFRTKDIPYLDVILEAVNNPLRMLAGWYLTRTEAIPITTKLIPLYGGFPEARVRPRQLWECYIHGAAERESILQTLCLALPSVLWILIAGASVLSLSICIILLVRAKRCIAA